MTVINTRSKPRAVTSKPTIPIIPVENIAISGCRKRGKTYWNKKGTLISITADANVPDGEMIIMVEKATGGDLRAVVEIAEGKLTTTFAFESYGHYTITKERVNSGLDSISAGFHFDFNPIEFDCHF